MNDKNTEGLQKKIDHLTFCVIVLSIVVAGSIFFQVSTWLDQAGFYNYITEAYERTFNARDLNTDLLRGFIFAIAAGVWYLIRNWRKKDDDDDDKGSAIKV